MSAMVRLRKDLGVRVNSSTVDHPFVPWKPLKDMYEVLYFKIQCQSRYLWFIQIFLFLQILQDENQIYDPYRRNQLLNICPKGSYKIWLSRTTYRISIIRHRTIRILNLSAGATVSDQVGRYHTSIIERLTRHRNEIGSPAGLARNATR